MALVVAACGSSDDKTRPAGTPEVSATAGTAAANVPATAAPSETVPQEQTDAANRFANEATSYYDLGIRICAASKLLKLFDVKRLNELSANAVPTDADAEKLYEAFAPCTGMNVLVAAYQSKVPRLLIDQSRCLNAEGPTIADSKPFVIAYLQRKPTPLVSTELQRKLRDAAIKCLTPDQQKAVGAV